MEIFSEGFGMEIIIWTLNITFFALWTLVGAIMIR